jgi:peroxiredoxin
MEKDLTAVLGSIRSKRYTLVVENNIVKQVFEGLISFFLYFKLFYY